MAKVTVSEEVIAIGYTEAQALNCRLEVKEIVEVVRRPTDEDIPFPMTWTEEMDDFVGKNGVVSCRCPDGIEVTQGRESWWFPYYVLESTGLSTEIEICGYDGYISGEIARFGCVTVDYDTVKRIAEQILTKAGAR
jgi:hypothetical protein